MDGLQPRVCCLESKILAFNLEKPESLSKLSFFFLISTRAYVCAYSHVPLRELAFEISQSFLACLGLSFWYTLVPSRLNLSQGALVGQQGFSKLEMTLMINLFIYPVILMGKLRKPRGRMIGPKGSSSRFIGSERKQRRVSAFLSLQVLAWRCDKERFLPISVFVSQSVSSSFHHSPRDRKENLN